MGIRLSILAFLGVVYMAVAVLGSLVILAFAGLEIHEGQYYPDISAHHARRSLKTLWGWPIAVITWSALFIYSIFRGLFAVITNK